MRRALPALALLIALSGAGVARAQVAVQRWQPSTAAGSFVAVEPPLAPVGYGLEAALWLQYAREPVVLPLHGLGDASVVTDQYTADLTGTVGVFDWLALSFALPATLYQGSGTPALDVNNAGFGDPRLLAKFVLMRPQPRYRGFGLMLIPELGLPLGDRRSLLGDRGYTFVPRAAVGWLSGPALIAANIGYRFRQGASIGELFIGNEILLALGADVPIWRLPLAATVELTAATAAQRPFMNLKETSVEGLASLRSLIGPVALQPGLAIGFTPGYLVPDFRLFLSIAFGPHFRDADSDGIADQHDRCPAEREDFDDYRDRDGCPEFDNDGDGIRDGFDRCPNRAGTPDNDGCPAAP
ncbi:MAG: hypothetical protein JXR83_20430 [Deltaproteobacteria bacterium]|nr:hypothetical protein [Deltaproteobacteria bacterium]